MIRNRLRTCSSVSSTRRTIFSISNSVHWKNNFLRKVVLRKDCILCAKSANPHISPIRPICLIPSCPICLIFFLVLSVLFVLYDSYPISHHTVDSNHLHPVRENQILYTRETKHFRIFVLFTKSIFSIFSLTGFVLAYRL